MSEEIMRREVSFEKMRDDYLSFVTEVYAYYVKNTTATFHMHELSQADMRDLVFFENPRHGAFIILDDGAPCGYAILREYSKREAYAGTAEITVYLVPEYTGKGIGGQVIRFIEDTADTNGIHVLIASICAENEHSIRLFERHGYVKCAHYREVGNKFGRLLDVVAYQKILP
jgi:phosphinothricin acetyltransferase